MKSERTSDTHPIMIDFIDCKWGESPAKLGITFAPGKKQKHALTGSWHRDLHKDIDRIANYYQIKTLVSLVESWEMEQLEIANQFQQCKKKGVNTFHFPVVDNQIPEDEIEFMRIVKEVVENHLRKGYNSVVHCKGGLGRAPTFACACLLYSGKSLEEAIKLVKSGRKNSLTNSNQLQFLKSLKF